MIADIAVVVLAVAFVGATLYVARRPTERNNEVARERKHRRRPVFGWSWPYWLATVAVMGLALAVFVAMLVNLLGVAGFLRVVGYALALSMFPCACVLFWFWYQALYEDEVEERIVPMGGAPVQEGEEREPILVKTLGRPQLEAPSVYDPAILVVLIKELWTRGELSRRKVMGLRLPSGSRVSRSMWERLIGGYVDEHGREQSGLLARAGLVVRTSSGWAWREGVSLGDVLACFDWGSSQIRAPVGPNAREDLEELWGE